MVYISTPNQLQQLIRSWTCVLTNVCYSSVRFGLDRNRVALFGNISIGIKIDEMIFVLTTVPLSKAAITDVICSDIQYLITVTYVLEFFFCIIEEID